MERNKPEPRAQIVATIGPSTFEQETIKKLIQAGLDMVRVNMSWGDTAEHEMIIERARAAARECGVQIPIMLDLSGPRTQDEVGHHFAGGEEAVTEKDIADIEFGAAKEVEYFALSYVGSGGDIRIVREHLARVRSSARVIAKIERAQAVECSADILAEADAIMVARGDLGNEVPLEKIPFIERDLVLEARGVGKPVIVATELMSSMIENSHPARADVTDVAYAIMCGADAVMLSNETAVGKFPVETVRMMNTVLLEAEKHRGAQEWHLL